MVGHDAWIRVRVPGNIREFSKRILLTGVPSAVYTLLQILNTLDVSNLCDFGHSGEHRPVPLCGFNTPFADDKWSGELACSNWSLGILLGEFSIQVFSAELSVFYLSHCGNSFYTVCIFLDTCTINIFSVDGLSICSVLHVFYWAEFLHFKWNS